MREVSIWPTLRACLQSFDNLNIWANDFALEFDERFSGDPEYLIPEIKRSRRAEPEAGSFSFPAETKKVHFTEDRDRRLAELNACHRLNERQETQL